MASYIIKDCNDATWKGCWWDDAQLNGYDFVARWATIRGASEALCHLAPQTERKRYPLRIVKLVPTGKK